MMKTAVSFDLDLMTLEDGQHLSNQMVYDADGLRITAAARIPEDITDQVAVEEYGYFALKRAISYLLPEYYDGMPADELATFWWDAASEANLTDAARVGCHVSVTVDDHGEVESFDGGDLCPQSEVE